MILSEISLEHISLLSQIDLKISFARDKVEMEKITIVVHGQKLSMHKLRLIEKVRLGCAFVLLFSCVYVRITELMYVLLKGKNGTTPEGSIIGHGYLLSCFLSISIMAAFQRRWITHKGPKLIRLTLISMIFIFSCGGYLRLRDLRAEGSKMFYFMLAFSISLILVFIYVGLTKVTNGERKLVQESGIVIEGESPRPEGQLTEFDDSPVEVSKPCYEKLAKRAALMEISIVSSAVTLGTDLNGRAVLKNDYFFSLNYLDSTLAKGIFLSFETVSYVVIVILLNLLIFAQSKTTHRTERFWLSLALAVSAASDFICFLMW